MQTYLESTDSEWFNQRLSGFMVLVLLAFAILIARLFYLQIVEGNEYRRLSEINSIRLQDIDAPRGLILDRSNQLLVDKGLSLIYLLAYQPGYRTYIARLKQAEELRETTEALIDVWKKAIDSSEAKPGKNIGVV